MLQHPRVHVKLQIYEEFCERNIQTCQDIGETWYGGGFAHRRMCARTQILRRSTSSLSRIAPVDHARYVTARNKKYAEGKKKLNALLSSIDTMGKYEGIVFAGAVPYGARYPGAPKHSIRDGSIANFGVFTYIPCTLSLSLSFSLSITCKYKNENGGYYFIIYDLFWVQNVKQNP